MIDPHVSTANASTSEMSSSRCCVRWSRPRLRGRHVWGDQPLGQHSHRDVFAHRLVESSRAVRQRLKAAGRPRAHLGADVGNRQHRLLAQLCGVGAHGAGELGVAPVQPCDRRANFATAPAFGLSPPAASRRRARRSALRSRCSAGSRGTPRTFAAHAPQQRLQDRFGRGILAWLTRPARSWRARTCPSRRVPRCRERGRGASQLPNSAAETSARRRMASRLPRRRAAWHRLSIARSL